LPKNGLVCNATADKQLALRIRGKWWLQIVSINLDILYLAKESIRFSRVRDYEIVRLTGKPTGNPNESPS
jgi:hypothetical protein